MSGAWVSRARLQAADGMPMPTKQMSLLRNARAAAMVIISLALWAIASSLRRVGSARGLRRLRGLACVGTRRLACGTRGMHGERLRSLLEHVRLHPGEKAVAVAGDRVPGLVKRVVALVVAVRIGWMRPARHAGNGADGPARQDHGVGAALPEVVDDLLHRDERTLRRPRENRERPPAAARPRRPRRRWPWRHASAPRSRSGLANRSRKHRGSGAASRRRGCRPRSRSAW